MRILKKLIIYLKYRKKKFKSIGENVDYKQIHSKYLFPQNITLNKNSKVLDYAYFDGVGGIEIGECTIIAPKCTIITSNHNYDEEKVDMLPFNNTLITKKVTIQKYCWIGRNVMIMPGVTIGKACIIAAGSVVAKSVNPYSIAGGNPAKLIKNRNKEKIDILIKDKNCYNNKDIDKNNKVYI